MKKIIGVIIVIIIIAIIFVLGLGIYAIHNNKTHEEEPELNISNSNEVDLDAAKKDGFLADGRGKDEEENIFLGYSSEEWEKMVRLFLANTYNQKPEKVECKYNENGEYVATVSSEYEVSAEYIFSSDTGYATERYSGVEVDIIQGVVIGEEIQSSIDFSDSEFLAIGYVVESNEAEFINQYIGSNEAYDAMDIYDFRSDDHKTDDYGNKFVIIPKNDEVTVTVYDGYIADDGQLYTDNTLIGATSNEFVLVTEYFDIIPNMYIRVEYEGFDGLIPIAFDGVTGKLDLSGWEEAVKDITLYN